MTSGAVTYLAGNLKGTLACHKAGLVRRRLRHGPIAPRVTVKLHCRTSLPTVIATPVVVDSACCDVPGIHISLAGM
jgi:hypothetical protein